tara:strand:+ start:941 stop:1255 length:315 start_codon:yes stop_codon:yes gene_type:complete
MSLFIQMKNTKGKVEYLLKKTPHLRDDDYKLIATFWWHEMGNEKCKLMTGFDFLDTFSRGNLTHPESIRRVRAKLQEENPLLRGVNYKRRGEDGRDTSSKISDL